MSIKENHCFCGKVQQELLWHLNVQTTLQVYTPAVSEQGTTSSHLSMLTV